MALHDTASSIPLADTTTLKVFAHNACPPTTLCKLNDVIVEKQVYEMVNVEEYAPMDRKKCYMFIQDLHQGLNKCVLCTYSVGGPMGNYHFIWCIPDNVSLEASLSENQKIITSIQASAPVYHQRALRRHLISQFGQQVLRE